MKIGLIGFGSIGQRHYKNLQKYTQNIVIFSKRKDNALSNVTNRWIDFINRGPFQAIFITNVTSQHVHTIKKCIYLKPQGIFIEKPLSHTTKDLERIAHLLKKNNISIWVGYNFHFYKPFIKIKKIIQSKQLGQLYYLRIFVGQDLRTWRARDYRLSYSGKRKQGGGVMLDLIHDINYPAWMLDDILIPQSAFIKKISSLAIDTEDYAESIFRTKNNIIVSVHQDYLYNPGKRSLEIVGENGSLYWDSIGNTIYTHIKQKKVIREKITVDHNKMYQKEVAFFFNCLRGRAPFSNIREAIQDVMNIVYLKKHAQR